MEIEKEDACMALIEGKLVIAYFGNNGNYKCNHLTTPLEIRLFGNVFCTYLTKGVSKRKLTGKNILKTLNEKFELLDIHPVFVLDERPV